ncbi:MAG: CBS domain-containing protein [Proteobacteria bacterium]|nr:CBS domain-containing protein [Pseudomonadota bacterium]
MKVGELCKRNAVSLSAAAPVSEALRLMYEENVGSVVATASPLDGLIAIGILTDRDIVCAQLAGARDLGQIRMADIMSADPLVLNEEDSIDDAIRRMRSRAVRRAPVLGAGGLLKGVISFDDLVAHVAENLAALARLMTKRSDRDGSWTI